MHVSRQSAHDHKKYHKDTIMWARQEKYKTYNFLIYISLSAILGQKNVLLAGSQHTYLQKLQYPDVP